MKLPFFRSSRSPSDTKKTATVPPIPARPVRSVHLAKTTRIEVDPETQKTRQRIALAQTQVMERFPSPSAAPTTQRQQGPQPIQPATPAPANGPSIPLAASSVASQIPDGVLAEGSLSRLASTTLMVPSARVLPQLGSGKVTMTLAELLALLPQELLNPNRSIAQAQMNIALPLADLVAAVPANQLTTSHEQSVDMDSGDFENIPSLFTPQQITEMEQPQTPEPVQTIETEPFAVAATDTTSAAVEPADVIEEEVDAFTFQETQPSHTEPAETHARETTPVEATTSLPSHVPSMISVSLRSLVGMLPDRLFAVPRAELWQKADPNDKASLSTAAIIPQLKTGRVVLPINTVVNALPQSLLVSPLPSMNNESVPLPLDEIIPQLPPDVFTLDKVEFNEETGLEDSNIPTPFAEKVPAPMPKPEPAKAVNLPSNIASTPTPEAVSATTPTTTEPVANEVSAAADTLSETAEITPTTAATVTPEPEPETKPELTSEPQVVAKVEETQESVVEPEMSAITPTAETTPVATTTPTEPEAIEPTPSATVPTAEAAPVESASPVEPVTTEPVQDVVTSTVETSPVEPTTNVVPETVEPFMATTAETAPETEAATVEEPFLAAATPVEEQATEMSAPTPTDLGTTEEDTTHVHDDDQDAVAEPNFAVDINKCTVEDLLKIRGIGQSTAKRIVEFRDAHGHIGSLEELREIPGIGRKTYRLLTGKQPRKINHLLGVDHDRELSLQEIVRLTTQLPGIDGCILALDDGMFLTGKLPEHLDSNSVSVFAPQLFRKVGRYTRELGVGKIQRFTIFTETQPMTIFQAGTVYMIVVHDSQRYSKVLLRRCERISKEIARLSQQRAVV